MMNKSHKPMPLKLRSLKAKFTLIFLRALKNINNQEKITALNNKGAFNVVQKSHKIKVASYASMAFAIGPNRAWTRAILLRICRGHQLRPANRVTMRIKRRSQAEKAQWAGPVHEELRNLVPGGETMDLKNLVEETAHYIKCLTTQVEVMKCIVDYCSTTLS